MYFQCMKSISPPNLSYSYYGFTKSENVSFHFEKGVNGANLVFKYKLLSCDVSLVESTYQKYKVT